MEPPCTCDDWCECDTVYTARSSVVGPSVNRDHSSFTMYGVDHDGMAWDTISPKAEMSVPWFPCENFLRSFSLPPYLNSFRKLYKGNFHPMHSLTRSVACSSEPFTIATRSCLCSGDDNDRERDPCRQNEQPTKPVSSPGLSMISCFRPSKRSGRLFSPVCVLNLEIFDLHHW